MQCVRHTRIKTTCLTVVRLTKRSARFLQRTGCGPKQFPPTLLQLASLTTVKSYVRFHDILINNLRNIPIHCLGWLDVQVSYGLERIFSKHFSDRCNRMYATYNTYFAEVKEKSFEILLCLNICLILPNQLTRSNAFAYYF